MHFVCPTTISVSGVTQSGKTTWIKNLLKYKKTMFEPPPVKILYCYGVWQLAFENVNAIFHHDLPTTDYLDKFADGRHCLVILDDLMDVVMKSEDMQRLFVRGSHHKNITAIYVNQNMFHQGKCARSINLNCLYLVLFMNPRDFSQIQYLGRQIGLGKTLVEAFQDSTKECYGYLVIDLSPHNCGDRKLYSHVFPGEYLVAYEPL